MQTGVYPMNNRKPIKPLKKQILYWITLYELKCCYCGRKYDNVKNRRTVDHVMPKSRGGEIRIHNVLIACEVCNVKKSDTDLEDFIKQNKRVKENLRKYIEAVKENNIMINNKSYYNEIKWIKDIIKKD